MSPVAELTYFTGPMDCGKSTLALQVAYTESTAGRQGRLFTMLDRSGEAAITSRIGLTSPAIEVTVELDLWTYVVSELTGGRRVDFLVCDEAQFYTPAHIDQLARIVDELQIDVFCFGILTDFRTELFPGRKRLIELADRVQVLQVEALCWCGRRATTNARVVEGAMVVEGEQVVVGDTAAGLEGQVEYEVLCRRHYMRRMTSHAARAAALSPEVLPFDLEVRPVPPLPITQAD